MIELIWETIRTIAQNIFKPIKNVSYAQNQVIKQIITMLIGGNVELGKLNESVEKTNQSIEEKIEEAQLSLVNTSKVIGELNKLIEKNQGELEKIRTEYEHLAELKKISLEQAQPLIGELSKTIKEDSKKNLWISFFISFIFFLCGALFGPAIYSFFVSFLK